MSTSNIAAPAALRGIVIATDFSPASDAAVLYSLALARRNNAKVWIVHVVSESFFSADTQRRAVDDAWREGHRRMTEHLIAGRLDGIETKLLVEQGSIYETLTRVVEEQHADLLVVGTRGRSRIGKLLLGSSAESIFRQAPCPVLTVGPRSEGDIPPEGPKKILFCTGFSRHSLAAGKMAVRLAARQGAELVLLHVGADTELDRDRYAKEADVKLRSWLAADEPISVPLKTMVRFGAASPTILSVASEIRPDLIVLGIRQPEGFARRLRWATAYDVVSNSLCPVLTVRTPDSEPSGSEG